MVNMVEIPHSCSQVSLSSGDSFCHQESGYLLHSHSGPAIHLSAFHIAYGISQNACDQEAMAVIPACGGVVCPQQHPHGAQHCCLQVQEDENSALCGSSPGAVTSSSLDPNLLLL